MAWEERKRGTTYYTRSQKVDGRVVRQYVGTGWVGELAAAEDALHREARELAAAEQRTERERLAELDAPLEVLDAKVEALYRAAMVLAGYRQHDRGQWRKQRG
jgi:hypothetical protein